jgi:hypothetical protein
MRSPRSGFLRGIVAAALSAAVLGLAGRAAAYCQEGTAGTPGGYDPTLQGCIAVGQGATGGLPLFWPNECVGYSLQRNASQQIALADAKRIATASFAAWTSATCPVGGSPSIAVFQYPDVDCDEVPSQLHNNAIIFRDSGWPHDDSANAIGYTTITADLDTGAMLGADIEINTFANMIVPDPPAPMGEYDLGSILTHEAGHFLGLAHSADKTAVMYAFYKPGSLALQPDDINGICSIYDPSGTRDPGSNATPGTTCDASPPKGFLVECGSADASVGDDGGADGGTGDDGGDPPPACPDPSCTSGPAAGHGGATLPRGVAAVGGLVALGALVRRRRRLARAGASLGVALALIGTSLTSTHGARASVAATVLFEELVEGATAAAVVAPVEQRAVWEDGRIVTYTRVRIDRLIAGQLPNEIWIATHGGVVGHIVQIVEGEPTLAIDRPSLVFVRPHLDPVTHAPSSSFVVVERAQGQFPVAEGTKNPRLSLAPDLGELLAPAPDHWTRAAEHMPAGSTARFAHDVLDHRPLDEAAREIAATWRRMHSAALHRSQ